MTDYEREERIAICLESGLSLERAEAIAACEAMRPDACQCGAGHEFEKGNTRNE